MINMIASLSTVVAALTVIIGAIIAVFKFFKKIDNGFFKKIDRLQEHVSENYDMTLRLSVCCSELPIEERIKAGDKYLERGGNGQIKVVYQKLLKEYENKT